MRAVVLDRGGELAVRSVRAPTPGIGEVLIEVAWCGICGTDRHIYHGEYGGSNLPLTLGHEFAGRIAVDPSDVLVPGTPVVADINVVCGRCRYCRMGESMACPSITQIGVDRSGAFAPLVCVPAAQVHVLPEHLPLDVAAMTEPLACVVHSQSKLRFTPADSVAVLGAGPIGVLQAQLALARGCACVMVTDVRGERLSALEHIDGIVPIDATADPARTIRWLTDGRGADVVIETAAAPDSYRTAFDAVRAGGQLLVFGIPSRDLEVPVSPYDLVVHELTVRGSNGAAPAAWPVAIDLLASGGIDVEHLLADRIDLASVVDRITGDAADSYKSIAEPVGAQG